MARKPKTDDLAEAVEHVRRRGGRVGFSSVGEYRDVTGAGGRVGPSAFPPRSAAELATLRDLLGVERPPEGVDTRATVGNRLRYGLYPEVVDHFPMGVRKIGRGKNAVYVPWGIPWKVIGAVTAVVIAAYSLERLAVIVANWWPGSKLAATSWSAVNVPVTFGQWIAQHINVNHGLGVIQSTVSPSGSGALAALQAAIPSPYSGQQATYGGNVFIYVNNGWQQLSQAL